MGTREREVDDESELLKELFIYQSKEKPAHFRSLHLSVESSPPSSLPLSSPSSSSRACRFSMLEFLLASGGCVPISVSAPQQFPSISDGRNFLAALRSLYEGEAWIRRVSFGEGYGPERSEMEELSFSRNPALQTIPLLAHDLALLEIKIQVVEHRSQHSRLLAQQCQVARLLKAQQQLPRGTLSSSGSMGNNVPSVSVSVSVPFQRYSLPTSSVTENQILEKETMNSPVENRQNSLMFRKWSSNNLMGLLSVVNSGEDRQQTSFVNGTITQQERPHGGSSRAETSSSWGTEALSTGSEDQSVTRGFPLDPEEGTVIRLNHSRVKNKALDNFQSSSGTPWPSEDLWSKSPFGAPLTPSPSGSAQSQSRPAIEQIWSPRQLAENPASTFHQNNMRQSNPLQVAADDWSGAPLSPLSVTIPRAASLSDLTRSSFTVDSLQQSGSMNTPSLVDFREDRHQTDTTMSPFDLATGTSSDLCGTSSGSLPIGQDFVPEKRFPGGSGLLMSVLRELRGTGMSMNPSQTTASWQQTNSSRWNVLEPFKHGGSVGSASSREVMSPESHSAAGVTSAEDNFCMQGNHLRDDVELLPQRENLPEKFGQEENILTSLVQSFEHSLNQNQKAVGNFSSGEWMQSPIREEIGQHSTLQNFLSADFSCRGLEQAGRVISESASASPVDVNQLSPRGVQPLEISLEQRALSAVTVGLEVPEELSPSSSNGGNSSQFEMRDATMEHIAPYSSVQPDGSMQLLPKAPTERLAEMTLEELSQYFPMPINAACRALGVGLTVLKKRCREFGVPRWPHRKWKSLGNLIETIQELAKNPEGDTSEPVQNAVQELENQKRKLQEVPGTELAERTKKLRQACFKAGYKRRRQASASRPQDAPRIPRMLMVPLSS